MTRRGFALLALVGFAFVPAASVVVSTAKEASGTAAFFSTACEGDYSHHLQGVCTDGAAAIFWCFTTELVRTDAKGTVLKSIPVENHHGDLCFHDGRIYAAVNLGRFNDPKGNADSWVYVYDADTLAFHARHAVPEVFHGAGGIGARGDHFFVVGGLPDGIEENYVFEYDSDFRFVKKHVIASGWTRLGIQTAAWHEGAWWFGCYGSPKILLKTDGDFHLLGRYELDCSLGVVGIAPGRFLIAEGPRRPQGRHRGVLRLARPDEGSGLKRIAE